MNSDLRTQDINHLDFSNINLLNMNKFYSLLLVLIVSSSAIQAQSGKQKKADRLYDDLAYLQATEVYKELIEKDYNTTHNNLRLGDAYMKLRSPENAVFYYGDVIEDTTISPEYYYKYAQALRGVKRYEESKAWLKKYLEAGAASKDISGLMEDPKYKIQTVYRLEKAEFNSENSDFGVFKKDDVLYFVSAREDGDNNKGKVYAWNGEPYLDIFQMDTATNTVTPVSGDINSKLHDGPLVISPDGKTAYFTRNNILGNKEGKRDDKQTNHLKIYKASLDGSEWKDVKELSINDNIYSTGHPAISPDGKTLYFTSDKLGGLGETDIYKVSINEDGSLGTPENLGAPVNTAFDEAFPFVDEDGILYFSSTGHGGLGLYDIYSYDSNNADAAVINLGAPINSNLDDFAYFKPEGTNLGYISSNRDSGSDDIYNFNRLNPLMVKGKVTDAVNDKPIAQATVRLMNADNDQVAFLETDAEGNYSTEVARNTEFPVEAKEISHETFEGNLSTTVPDDQDIIEYNIQLQPIKDVEYLAEINNIYFDFDKSNIRPDAAAELDKLVALMQEQYPELVIEIGSHTDRRGSDAYNVALAERRAKATFDYLVSKGVSDTRIESYKGYGETMPAVTCDRCSKEEHQLNRRSMFKVVKMD